MRRGYTLVEILVVVVLLLAAGTLIATLFTLGHRFSDTAYSNYLVSRGTEEGIDWLRRDLQNSALASVRVFGGEHPGISMVCCTTPDEPARPVYNSFGAPVWQSEVFYRFEKVDDKVGHLTRWARSWDKPLPAGAGEPAKPEGKHQHTVLQNLLKPAARVPGAGDQAGFKASFVQRQGGEGGEEALSSVNPAEGSLKGDYESNTRLVQIELRMLEESNSGQPSVYSIEFRVCPRY